MAPAFAYPTFAGPTGGAATPSTHTARGFEVALSWQRLLFNAAESYSDRVGAPASGLSLSRQGLGTASHLGANQVDRADALTGSVLWGGGNGRWEIGGIATSINSIQPGGELGGTGFGVNGKWVWTKEDDGASFGSAIGASWVSVDKLFRAEGIFEEDVDWLSVYLALSRHLSDQIEGTVGVAFDKIDDLEHFFLTHGEHFEFNEDEFNYFASLAISSRDGRSTFWAEYRTGAGSGEDALYALTLRRDLGGHWAGQVGWSNAKGPLFWVADEGSWFAGLMYRVR